LHRGIFIRGLLAPTESGSSAGRANSGTSLRGTANRPTWKPSGAFIAAVAAAAEGSGTERSISVLMSFGNSAAAAVSARARRNGTVRRGGVMR
jgi:hypothetical protein